MTGLGQITSERDCGLLSRLHTFHRDPPSTFSSDLLKPEDMPQLSFTRSLGAARIHNVSGEFLSIITSSHNDISPCYHSSDGFGHRACRYGARALGFSSHS